MTLLYHIGATLNTGYLPCHDLMQQRSPGIVAKYEPFDRSNPFDPIKICGAIIDPSEYDVSKHGILSTIIEYHISYTYSNGKPFKLSLSLRINMSMNSIGGLLTIIKSQIELRQQWTVYLFHEFKTKFPIIFATTKRAKNYMNTININIVEPELTVAKGLEIALLDASGSNVNSLE